ncbi:MAG TPA: hypothetical protein VGF84_01825 [Micromonosporaceae bacterium]
MIVRTRIGVVVATAALAAIAMFSMAACSGTPASAATMSPEQSALTTLGFSQSDITAANTTDAPAAAASAAPGKGKHPRLRRLAIKRLALRGHVEHGQVTVQTKTGDKTIDVQRGTITAMTSSTMTVKSTDGYTLTWTTTGPMTVIQHRTSIQPGELKVGDAVGVAGTQSGATALAKLVVVPNKKAATTGS